MKKIILTVASLFLLVSCGNGGSGGQTSSSGSGTASTSAPGTSTPNASTSSVAPIDIEYSISWKNYDGSLLRTDKVKKGVVPSYGSTNPTRPSDGNYTYTFKEWSPVVVAATADATYTAKYDAQPIYNIDAAQFEEAVKFKDKNFTADIEYDDDSYHEHFRHLATNEFYGTINNGSTSSVRRLISEGEDDFAYYDGIVDGDGNIDWVFQDGCSGTYNYVYNVDSAYDDDLNIIYIIEVINNFAELEFNEANNCYLFSKSGTDVTLTFHGNQLHYATFNSSSYHLHITFSNYGTTALPEYDEDLVNYRAKQYADKGTLSSFAHNTNYYYDRNIDFQFAYSKRNKSTEGVETTNYEVFMDNQYRQIVLNDTDVYVQEVTDDTLYKQGAGDKFYEITNSTDPGYGGMDFSNPYNEGFGQDFLTGFFEFKLLVDEGSEDDWENYVVTREHAEFDVFSEHFNQTLHFAIDFYDNPGINKFAVMNFEFSYETADYIFTYSCGIVSFNIGVLNPDIVL